MPDQLPSGSVAIYVFLEMIALAFIFGAVEALVSDKPWYIWSACLVLGLLFFLAGIKWGTRIGFIAAAFLVCLIIGYGIYRYFHLRAASAQSQGPPKSSQGSNYVPPPSTAFVIDDSSKVTCDNCGFEGYQNGGIVRNGSHDIQFKDLIVTSSTSGSFDAWKQRVFDDAGNPQKVKDDFEWFKMQMEPVWARDPNLQRAAEEQFQRVEDVFVKTASDKSATRQLLSNLVASPKDKPPPKTK